MNNTKKAIEALWHCIRLALPAASPFYGKRCSLVRIPIALSLLVISPLSKAEVQPPVAAPSQFIGAELAATVTEPGKVKIILQTFYSASEASVPEMETVSLFENMVMTAGRTIELKKDKENVYSKYAPVGNTVITRPAVKCVIYTGLVDVGLFRTSYKATWAYAGLRETFNNVALGEDEALALKVNISNPVTDVKNNVPILNHPPLLKVSANAKSGFGLDLTDNENGDKAIAVLTAPEVLKAPSATIREAGSILTERKEFQTPEYKKGFSKELPGAKAFSYHDGKKEISADNPATGKYLLQLSISEYRDEMQLSSHNAIFIVESIL